jgi:DNA-binding LacI/PurR family transcriptional regulator
VGFGDSPPARCAAPPLTSVRVSADEIAARTTDALLTMLAGGTADPIEVNAKLVLRESTGVAP